jgi:RNA polymerase sigma-70 factor (sigma-E family)
VEKHKEVRVDGDFTAYVAARRPRLVRTAVLLGCPESDAEDLVQTALARCLRAWKRVAKADNRDAYVHRVLVNAHHDARARRWNGELPTERLPESTAAGGDLVDGLVVRRALATLSAEHREVLVLRYFADLGERQTAEVLGVAPGTVKSRTARALAALSAHDDIAALAGERRP